jgi:EAL domain-containing protein (putative c-di-GMP-specific phosphodiesterase class I)
MTSAERRSPTPGALRKREAVHQIKSAKEEGHLVLLYQAVVDPVSGVASHVEALLRWAGDGSSPHPLSRLIAAAERSPVIFRLQDRTMAEACRDAARWRGGPLPALRVNVNVSAREFDRADPVRRVRRHLTTSGLAPAGLALEITETSGLRDLEAVGRELQRLKDLGVQLWLDDFGTGHSSLEWLSHFPVDGLKIPATFLERLDDRRSSLIVTRLIELAHDLGLRVVAEGVETESQREFVAARGCDLVQGFLFHEAVPAEALSRSVTGQT